MGEEVKLFGMWASPFSHTVDIALKFKEIQFQYIEEDLSNKSPLLLKYNPVHKKIPVLLHNGKPIAESLVIIEYIDETWPNNPILPKDPYDKAMARFWAKFVHEKIFATAIKGLGAQGKEKEQIIEEVHQQLKFLENELKGKNFFGGETIGYLDIVTFCLIYGFQVIQDALQLEFISEEKFPAMWKWIGRVFEFDAVKESLPPRQKHIDFVKARFGPAKTS